MRGQKPSGEKYGAAHYLRRVDFVVLVLR